MGIPFPRVPPRLRSFGHRPLGQSGESAIGRAWAITSSQLTSDVWRISPNPESRWANPRQAELSHVHVEWGRKHDLSLTMSSLSSEVPRSQSTRGGHGGSTTTESADWASGRPSPRSKEPPQVVPQFHRPSVHQQKGMKQGMTPRIDVNCKVHQSKPTQPQSPGPSNDPLTFPAGTGQWK